MKIGDVSQELGIPASTIRYYERIGLIRPQPRVSGRRVFDSHAILALEFVRLAQAAGFTIAETRALQEAYAEDPSRSGAWVELASRKQEDIREQIRELRRMDGVLRELLSCSCASLRECVEKGAFRRRKARRAGLGDSAQSGES